VLQKTGVNNSVYTNVIAKMTLDFAIAAAAELHVHASPRWAAVSAGLRILVDETNQVHLEYDGYDGRQIKQADVVLLGFPLELPMSPQMRRNDLVYYGARTDQKGPAMTWAMHVIAWLELGEPAEAARLWPLSFANAHEPFQIWTETPTGGAVNFITGAGGFLQAILFGYGGIRLEDAQLKFNPQLPPNVTALTLGRIHYLGNEMRLSWDTARMTIERLNKEGGSTLLMTAGGETQQLEYRTPIAASRGPFALAAKPPLTLWGFPLRFWLIILIVIMVALALVVGIAFVFARRQQRAAEGAAAAGEYEPVSTEEM